MKSHQNSILSYRQGLAEGLFSDRQVEVLRALDRLGIATDREIKVSLGYEDGNAVKPRLTELIALGVVEEVGTIEDAITNRTVRRLRITQDKPEEVVRAADVEPVLAQGNLL